MDVKITVGLKREPKIRASVPALSYHGGPLLANVEVTTIYWGSAWATDPLRTELDEFFNFAVTSSLIDQLSEYTVANFIIGHGKHVQSVLLGDDPATPLDDTAIQARLDELIAAGTVPPKNDNSVYFFFLPSGVTVTIDGSASCAQFCGYHNVSNSGVVYAVDTYDDCQGCQFTGDTLSSSTVTASHELCEAITDPQLDGWYDDNTGEEIGDICEGSTKQIGGGVGAEAVETVLQGETFTISGTGTALADGTISGNFVLTPTAAPPPPPPPPPTPGQSWAVQKEWSNAQGTCI